MRSCTRLVAICALLAFGSAGCKDFLQGPGLTQDPNNPSTASRDQRLAAVQAALTVQFTGTLARAACMFMQQCAGVDRQYATLARYTTTEDDFDTEFTQVYAGGGLVDIRFIQAEAAAAGDAVYKGVAEVLEAMDVGIAADLWGDIPYSEAVGTSRTPHFDSQQSVYAAVQAVLDNAIADLAGAGAGPGAVDLWYGGSKTKWTQLAHTLKARYYLHVAEQLGAPAYASAAAQARLGISTSANDLFTFQSVTTSENNVWYQFQIVQRDTYLRMGATLVDSIMNKRADPRLADYFAPVSAGPPPVYHGAPQGGPYNPATQSNLSGIRIGPAYRQSLVSHAENQLILAEAVARSGAAGTEALDTLNAERTAAGFPTPLVAITGQALIDSIMVEKYVVTFQNLEAWNDYKRTCTPALKPAGTATAVIARPLYGSTEINTNPNFPGEPASGRNWNDPNPCP